jgi:hypothetical protein
MPPSVSPHRRETEASNLTCGRITLVDVADEQYPAPTGGVASLRARLTGGPAAALFLSLEAFGQGCLCVISFPPPPLSSLPSSSPPRSIHSLCLLDTVAVASVRFPPSPIPLAPPPLLPARRLFAILTNVVVCTTVDSFALAILANVVVCTAVHSQVVPSSSFFPYAA